MTTVTPRFRCFSVRTQTPETSFADRAVFGKSAGDRRSAASEAVAGSSTTGMSPSTLYGKGVKDDLTPAERAAWRKVVEEIKNG